MKKFFLLLCPVIVCLSVQAQVQVQDLQTESLKDPLGIDARQPRLSWQLSSKEKNILQLAYEIRVGNDPSTLAQTGKLVWRTGKVTSNESLHISYAGSPLQSAQKYYWQVRIWDNKGRPSEWSKPASWQMGLLASDDWKAKWIGLDVDYQSPKDDHRRLPARMARREFQLKKPITRATLFLSGLGFSELYLNGKKVGDRIMDPTHSNYDKRVLYTTYDVTKYLQQGNNAIGVWLGNGRFFSPRIHIPATTANTTATLYIPTKDPASVKEGIRPVKDNPKIIFKGMEHGTAVYEIGSGAYEFSASTL